MALCGSQNCGCAFASSATIAVTGSGTPGSPYTFTGTVSPTATLDVFTASGTWTKPAGLAYIEVEVQAGGGGSAGSVVTAAGQYSLGTGGGGGGYTRKVIAAAALAATEAVTVGLGGTAGAAGGNGGTGGTSSFGAHCSATGGGGGTATAAGAPAGILMAGVLSAGGTGSGGDIDIPGAYSVHGIVSETGGRMIRPHGGASVLGPGVRSSSTVTGSVAGIVGPVYGGGATGSGNVPSQAAVVGAAGGAGIVIVREYF